MKPLDDCCGCGADVSGCGGGVLVVVRIQFWRAAVLSCTNVVVAVVVAMLLASKGWFGPSILCAIVIVSPLQTGDLEQ